MIDERTEQIEEIIKSEAELFKQDHGLTKEQLEQSFITAFDHIRIREARFSNRVYGYKTLAQLIRDISEYLDDDGQEINYLSSGVNSLIKEKDNLKKRIGFLESRIKKSERWIVILAAIGLLNALLILFR